MSKYTVELRQLINSGYDLGLENYPIFDEDYRAILNAKIIDHFEFREIGAETPGRFKKYLNRTMNEIMPYYNQLYASAALTLNPLSNFNLTESTTRENTGSSLSTSEATGSSSEEALRVGSNMPQSLITAADLKANLFASDADRSENSNTQNSAGTQLNTGASLDIYTRNLAGVQGMTQSAALLEFRKTFLNIDMMIINDLASCFMEVY